MPGKTRREVDSTGLGGRDACNAGAVSLAVPSGGPVP